MRLAIRFVCSDMWKPYLNVIAEQLSPAVHVLDRFHIMKKMNEAIDEVRRGEARRLRQDGYEPVLKKSRWCLLKRRENLTDKQTVKLAELLRYNLQSVRSYLMREDFQRFWEYVSPAWAGKFLDQWCTASHAEPDRTDEESRFEPAGASRPDPQLVPCPRHHFGGRGRGVEQQSETDYQKSVWFSYLRRH